MISEVAIETVEYRLLDEEQVCSCCGGALYEMSVEVRKELAIVPVEVSFLQKILIRGILLIFCMNQYLSWRYVGI
ncbi:hypothetical protein COL91_18835 [Bacillus pseudomycoides]|nr:IS66 family transposase zinc-finger binding domain-containing protein [Bacillus pseudomycoides]PEE44580.1 hypothetical protein COO02_01655 [Bacillus pseudomycoides]PEI91229.1 hypothetical protein CN679_14760 [Bacillus pseudomycoides]PGA89098.1 hypothetical protein COL91_18835 [Bacillus pseudomycoides]PHF46683.1 hypothetical protein COF72_11845 [Bacillus pseudomycoides]